MGTTQGPFLARLVDMGTVVSEENLKMWKSNRWTTVDGKQKIRDSGFRPGELKIIITVWMSYVFIEQLNFQLNSFHWLKI